MKPPAAAWALVTEQATAEPVGDGQGVALLNPDRTVLASTPAAARWFAELADLDPPRPQRLPTVVESAVARLTSTGGGDLGVARSRVLTSSGQWLTVHASRLDDAAGPVAVVVERTSPTAARAARRRGLRPDCPGK